MLGCLWLRYTNASRCKLIRFSNAVYCYEELLVLQPERFELFVKLAELHFTIGKLDNLILARKYFSFVLTVNGMALRPLMGLLRTCEMLSVIEKDNEMNDKLVKIVTVKLRDIYGSKSVAPAVKGAYKA